MTEPNNSNFNFEIDNSVYLNHKDAIKIFGHDEMTIKKLIKYLLIIGGILLLPFILKTIINLITIFFNNDFSLHPNILNYMGLALFLSGIYVKRNFRKIPMVIVYKDKIMFKNKKTYTNFPLLRILDLYDLYRMGNYTTLQKNEIKCIVNPENNYLDNKPYFELKANSLKYSILLNANKDYQKYIYTYLSNYLETDKTHLI
ncbi:hypothetical protein SGQ44_05795 [Flavobacterium sp. Fl-77]|uniref:Uncharacterized protein n=1 Tax=Flavobacterium flavipigmentatum TaxID=2893884 RepID=A0AAJ2SFC4_9FLAO|nr:MULTISPECIES: hypothetical protein [unclassified Flavobacterium]MDX6181707.1 hypothetical protein [Flavobacterium sp. Fl-33]MDX6185259.1 hypothetical protein [Flavobacterium sp. Fl-77]UFH37365.1 hypothetical protein LNP22_11525 [Flavobacterium sp. F-70]